MTTKTYSGLMNESPTEVVSGEEMPQFNPAGYIQAMNEANADRERLRKEAARTSAELVAALNVVAEYRRRDREMGLAAVNATTIAGLLHIDARLGSGPSPRDDITLTVTITPATNTTTLSWSQLVNAVKAGQTDGYASVVAQSIADSLKEHFETRVTISSNSGA